MRLDVYLVDKRHAQSRRRAQDMIDAGHVMVNGFAARKASSQVGDADKVTIVQEDHPYVCRGALKLKGLLDETGVRFDGKTVLDIGSSTGGFTQISLEYGAKQVYAVDVGTDQLHQSLRTDKRITLCEQMDARKLNADMFPAIPTILTADLSFISLQKVLPGLLEQFTAIDKLCLLVKPQFELEPNAIGKGGLVKQEEDRQRALRDVEDCIETLGFQVRYDMESPLVGGDGNVEYMVYGLRLS